MLSQLNPTPLFPLHQKLGAKLVPFAGFSMPLQYKGILEEADTVRKRCGLFDVSHMGRFSSRHPEALAILDSLVTNDLSKLKEGRSQYNLICREDGGVLDDWIVTRRPQGKVAVCVNAANLKKDWDWIQKHSPPIWEDESAATFLVALQGPTAEQVLARVLGSEVAALWYLDGKAIAWKGGTLWVSRSGYTGEDGFEIEGPAALAEPFWEALFAAGAEPCGLGARDTLRIEVGYPLYGHELTEDRNPFASGLHWAVKLAKQRTFVGQEELKGLQKETQTLMGFLMEDRRIARQGSLLRDRDGKTCGVVTSGTFSPTLQRGIGLAWIEKSAQGPCSVELRGEWKPVHLQAPPLVPTHLRRPAK